MEEPKTVEVEVAPVSDFTDGGRGIEIQAAGTPLIVWLVNGTFHALCANCPHAGASLLFSLVEPPYLICGLHGWRFEFETGKNPDHPGKDLPRYPVEVRDGTVYVTVPKRPRR